MVNATNFDGTNDNLLRGGDLTGNANSKVGIVSLWVKFGSGSDGQHGAMVAAQGSPHFLVRKSAAPDTNKFLVSAFNASSSEILNLLSVSTYTVSDGWIHFLASWDLSAAASHLYINDSDDNNEVLNTNDTIDYTRSNHAIGSFINQSQRLNGCLSEVYVNYAEFLDFSVEANRRLFVTSDLKAVNLGSDGSTPTGTAPIIYLPNPFGTFEENEGTGGDYTVTGSLTACADAPPEAPETITAEISRMVSPLMGNPVQQLRRVVPY
jgi:hypothetical protein